MMKFPAGFILNWIFPKPRWMVLIGGLLGLLLSSQIAVSYITGQILENVIGVKVSVNRFFLKPHPFELGLYGIRIHNPPGFSTSALAEIPEIFFRVNLAALLKGKTHLREIRINMEDVVVERNKEGKINLNEVIRLLNEKEKASKSAEPLPDSPSRPVPKAPPPQKKTSKPMKVEIDRVLLTVGQARYVDSGSGKKTEKKMTLNIQNFELKNVTDPASVAEQVIVMILKRAGLMAAGEQLEDLRRNLNTQLQTITGQIQETFQEWFK